MRVPKHIGIIPDGNMLWDINNNLQKELYYKQEINSVIELFKLCQEEGIEELTFYVDNLDNSKHPYIEKESFTKAYIDAIMLLTKEDCEVLVVGYSDIHSFPSSLLPFTKERKKFGKGGIKVNFLIHYSWIWDLNFRKEFCPLGKHINPRLKSREISNIDLIIRWGGLRRLSGFLPVQSTYADFYAIDDMWLDFKKQHLYDALNWYAKQDSNLEY